MPWGFVAAAAVGAAGSIIASDKQAGAQKQAAATQQGMFDTIQSQNQPFVQGGYAANTKLQDLLGLSGNTGSQGYGSLTSSFSPSDYLANKDPGYEFQLKTGAQATRNADTPGVGSLSGAALKDLMSFNQNMAATGYQNAFNRYQTQQNNTFQRLHDIAGLGQASANNTSAAGTSLGSGIAQSQAATGATQASGVLGAPSSLSNLANTLGSQAYLNNSGSSLDYYPPSSTRAPSTGIGSDQLNYYTPTATKVGG